MIVCGKAYPPSVNDIKVLLLVQAHFEKFHQELSSPNVSANVAQATQSQEIASLKLVDAFGSNKGGKGCGNHGK